MRRALWITLLALTAGCGANVDAAQTPGVTTSSAGRSPSAAPTPTATADAEPTASQSSEGLQAPDLLPSIGPDSLATVVSSDVVVRSLPEISEASIIHPTYLQDGHQLFVVDGPVSADGYAWYLVVPFLADPTDDTVPEEPTAPIGWVASGTPSDPWILPSEVVCPSADLESIWRQPPLLLLACFGDQEMTLEGARGECTYVVPGSVVPAWLDSAWCEIMPFDLPSDAFSLGRLTLHYHQDTSTPLVTDDRQTPIQVVGHFDDPAARACRDNSPLMSTDPNLPALVVTRCRSAFVATEVTEITGR